MSESLDGMARADWRERQVEGFSGFQELSKFGDGQSNPTYKVSARSGEYVLRTKPPGVLLKSAHAVDREYRLMRALQATAFAIALS